MEENWIPVEERLPGINVVQGVLVFSERGGIDVQPVYNNGNWEPTFQKGWRRGECYEVTHWQPLPSPPAKTSKKEK